MSAQVHIEKAKESQLDELESLYNNLNDHLASTLNYPGWIKDIYPTRETAVMALKEGSLFVALCNGVIAGSIILNHEPEEAYTQVKWLVEADYSEVIIVRTLVVNPAFLNNHIATSLMEFAKEYAISKQMKSLRLDVSINNIPAIKLYRKMGYTYLVTIDLGLPYEHLKWFDVYELVLKETGKNE